MIPVVKCQQQKIGIKFLHRMGSKLLCIFCIVLKYQVFVGGSSSTAWQSKFFQSHRLYRTAARIKFIQNYNNKKKTTHKRPAKGTNGKGA